MAERLLRRLGHHYILVMMIATRLFGSIGGLLVIYYVELTSWEMPIQVRMHWRIASVVVVIIACALTVFLAMYETRSLRRVLRALIRGQAADPAQAVQAGREAVMFVSRHHRHEAWLVPCSTLVPVLIFLKVVDDVSATVMGNITIAVFMGISMALMSTFFAIEHCMQPVIRCLLDHGDRIDYTSLPVGNLRFRLRLCFTLIIITTAMMIGTLA
ncbi:MAG: hypothetical protein HY000_38930, partial [Planctomycetes bacterium]|nr:hypothetical protein [Planctomycetota bacterium]